MKRVTNLDWEVTSHRSQVTRSRHIWTDFRARAVSFGRKILLWASIMFAQRLTICEIDAKFSIFLFSSSHPWHYRPGYRQGGPHMTDCAPTLVIPPIWGCQCRGHYKWYILHTGSGGRVITVGKCITTDDDGETGRDEGLATHSQTSPARHRYNEVFTRHFANSFFISLDNKPPSFFPLLPWVALY